MNKLLNKLSSQNIAITTMIALFFMADRILKSVALKTGALYSQSLVGDIFIFRFTANPNMSFSLAIPPWLLYSLIFLVIALLVYYIFYLILNKKGHKWEILLLTIILFGAISNILDRCLYGYVVDYLELKYFTVFNLADVMISGGALVLILNNLRIKK
jgi:signal peptidase II